MTSDIVVVGGGMAGMTAAFVLGRQGARVTLIDPHPYDTPLFRAEKIITEHRSLLDKFGLLNFLAPPAGLVTEVCFAFNSRVFRTMGPLEEYCLRYDAMVNALRDPLPSTVTFRAGQVEQIVNSSDVQRVKLLDGEEMTSRLVVLACGGNYKLQTQLGFQRRVLQKHQCFVLGFTMVPAGGQAFNFDTLTCFPATNADAVDYLTVFRFHQSMRGNLFIFRPANDPWIHRFQETPERLLERVFPWLTGMIGDYRVSRPIETGVVDLYRMEGPAPAGVAVIGDAFQSACPATGLGLLKLFTDVDALYDSVPRWLASPGMGSDKLRDYYDHPPKRAMDLRVIQSAIKQRRFVLDASFRGRLRRRVAHFRWELEGFAGRLKAHRHF